MKIIKDLIVNSGWDDSTIFIISVVTDADTLSSTTAALFCERQSQGSGLEDFEDFKFHQVSTSYQSQMPSLR